MASSFGTKVTWSSFACPPVAPGSSYPFCGFLPVRSVTTCARSEGWTKRMSMKKVMMAKSTTPVCCVISAFDWCISVSSSRCSSVGYMAPVEDVPGSSQLGTNSRTSGADPVDATGSGQLGTNSRTSSSALHGRPL